MNKTELENYILKNEVEKLFPKMKNFFRKSEKTSWGKHQIIDTLDTMEQEFKDKLKEELERFN